MKYFSMFTGIGGFELGIQNAYRNTFGAIENDSADDKGSGLQSASGKNTRSAHRRSSKRIANNANERPLCIGYSEIDSYAIKTYERHFTHENYGDATTIDTDRIPDIDLLVGGFPCQAFSVAGRRAGFDDARGTLFFEIARVLTNKRPRHFLLENVLGLLSNNGGKTFAHILEILTEIGYCVEWQILNSKDFGVPQNRERVYIVGHLGVECGREIFPITQSNGAHLSEITTNVSDAQRIYTTDLAKSQKALGGGLGAKTGLYAVHKNHDSIVKTEPISHSLDSSYYKGLDNHGQRTGILNGDMRVRRLTPVECERLQGFPDNWTSGSDTQRYKQCGNAVTVNVVTAVMERLLPCIYDSDNV